MRRAGTIFILTVVTASLAAGIAWTADSPKPADTPKEFEGLPLVFHDDFGSGADRWEPTDAKAWKVTNENGNPVYSLCGESAYEPPVRSPKNIAWIRDLNVTDFILEVRIKQTGREYGHRDGCIFFGHNDPTHFYYVHIATKADEHANSVFIVNGAPRVSIAKERTEGTNWGTDYHTVRLVRKAESGSIQVFFDNMDKPTMVAEDKTFASGGIGLGSFDDTANFDDVKIWGKKK